MLAYADDVAIFCTDRQSVLETISDAKRYCRQTGCEINWDKSIGFWHGSWDNTPSVFANLQWSVSPTKYLGVPLEHYESAAQYWEEETSRVKEKTGGWQGRDLSMFARATVCNLFLIAKVWYVLQFCR